MKINKKIIFLTIAILAAVAILLFSQNFALPATAQKSALKDILKLNTSATEVVVNAEQDFSNSRPVDPNQATKNTDILAKAKQLIGKAESKYLTAGWLHMVSKDKAFVMAQKTFPDGSPIPSESTTEEWVLLDKKGDAIKAVRIQDTGDPRLLQISVYKNGVWTNISLGTTESAKYHPGFDTGILGDAITYKDILKLATGTSVVNGQKTVVFSTQENLKTPMSEGKNQQKDQQMYGYVVKYYFAEASGLPVQTESYKINSAGSLEILDRILYPVTEKVAAPPANILAYFTK